MTAWISCRVSRWSVRGPVPPRQSRDDNTGDMTSKHTTPPTPPPPPLSQFTRVHWRNWMIAFINLLYFWGGWRWWGVFKERFNSIPLDRCSFKKRPSCARHAADFFFFFFYYFLTSWCFICLFFFFLRIRFFSFFFPSTLRFSFNEMDQKLIASLLHLLWTFNGILQTTQTQYQNGHFNLPLVFLFCLQYP